MPRPERGRERLKARQLHSGLVPRLGPGQQEDERVTCGRPHAVVEQGGQVRRQDGHEVLRAEEAERIRRG